MPNDNVLTERQRMDLLLVADDMSVSGDAKLAEALRALLAAHPRQTEPLAEVTDEMVEAAAFAYDTFPYPHGESVGRGPHLGQLRATLQAAIDAARTGGQHADQA